MQLKEHNIRTQEIYDRYKGLRNIAEVGVGPILISQAAPWIENRSYTEVLLVDPLLEHYNLIQSAWGSLSGIHLVRGAIVDTEGEVDLRLWGGSSFIEGLRSPASYCEANGNKDHPLIKVPGVRFDNIDSGNIDVLFVDTEGSEWFVLKHMKSRPYVIKLEMHDGGRYRNPYEVEIRNWMSDNGYRLKDVWDDDELYECKK